MLLLFLFSISCLFFLLKSTVEKTIENVWRAIYAVFCDDTNAA